jgi:hypothetical protein
MLDELENAAQDGLERSAESDSCTQVADLHLFSTRSLENTVQNTIFEPRVNASRTVFFGKDGFGR